MFQQIVTIISVFVLPFVSSADFLTGVTAENVILDTIETPSDSIAQYIADNRHDYWFGKTVHHAIYSPDSSMIAEERQETPGGRTIGLWIVDRNNKTEKKIVDGIASGSQWSPDGNFLAFSTMVPISIKGRHGYKDGGVWIYNLKNGELQAPPFVESHAYQWSPTENYLASKHLDSTGWNFVVHDPETKITKILDKSAFFEPCNFSWSPNGKMLVYIIATKSEGHIERSPVESEVYIINHDGTGKNQLTNTAQPEILVKWQLDGWSIIVERFKNAPEPIVGGGGEREVVILKLKKR